MIMPRRIFILLFLGFASGLPLALTTSTLSAWYTETGMSLASIGLLSLVGQPYVYKFLWAPLADRFDLFGLGRRRSWMIATQIPLGLLLFAMSRLNPPDHPLLLAFLAFLVALFSATQDIPISGYLTEAPLPHERGLAASFYNTSYRIAVIFASAVALIMAQYYGWHLTYMTMGITMVLFVVASLFTPEPKVKKPPVNFRNVFIEPFSELATRFGMKTLILILFIAIIYKLTDAFALSLSSYFFLHTLQYSLVDMGTANKLFGTIFSILGGLAAGMVMYRLKLFQALVWFGIIQALANLVFVWLYLSNHTYINFAIAIGVDNFASGLGTTAFLALLMGFCHKEFAGTQFALLSAIASFGRVYMGPVAAMVAEKAGWVWFFVISTLIGLFAVGMLFCVKKIIVAESEEPA